MELGDLVIVPDMHIKKNGEYLPVYYFGDDGGDPEPSRAFNVVHNNTGVMSIIWRADVGASFNVNWGDGTIEPFTDDITHDYSSSGAAPFTITLEGDQSEINKIRRFNLPYQDTTVTSCDLFNLYGLRDLDIFEVDALTTLGGIGAGHTEAIDVLVAHCDVLAGVLDFRNVFDITAKFNCSLNTLVTNILRPTKTIDTAISNFKLAGSGDSGFTGGVDIDVSNFTNLSGLVSIASHTSTGTLTLPTVWGGTVTIFSLNNLGHTGALDLRNIDTVTTLRLYSNPNVTSYDLRTINFVGASDISFYQCFGLNELLIDDVVINTLSFAQSGFTDFIIPLGTNIVFETSCNLTTLSLTQLAVDTIVENIWDNKTKWTVPVYTPTLNMLNTTVSSGTFDGTTDWPGGIPSTPQAKLWDLANNHGFTIQNNT